MLNAGKYNKKISIYEITEEINEHGFKTKVKTNFYEPYAYVKTTKGYTLISSGSDFEKAYTNFTIRYPKTYEITRDMMIDYNNKTYTIEYLNNVDEENIELEIQAKEVTK